MSEHIDPRAYPTFREWATVLDTAYTTVDVPDLLDDVDWRAFVDDFILFNPGLRIPEHQIFDTWQAWADEFMLRLTVSGA